MGCIWLAQHPQKCIIFADSISCCLQGLNVSGRDEHNANKRGKLSNLSSLESLTILAINPHFSLHTDCFFHFQSCFYMTSDNQKSSMYIAMLESSQKGIAEHCIEKLALKIKH